MLAECSEVILVASFDLGQKQTEKKMIGVCESGVLASTMHRTAENFSERTTVLRIS